MDSCWADSLAPNRSQNANEAWHSMVRTVLSPLRNLDITGPSLKGNCADGFHTQCYPILAAWVGDYPEQVMVALVPDGSCLICEMPKCALMGNSSFDHSITQDISMLSQSFWTNIISMFRTLLVCIQSDTSSGNTLSAMSIGFGSLMYCISCFWV